MKTLDLRHPVSPELLNSKYYFQSLLEQALVCGLLSGEEVLKIQADLLFVLARQANKWNKGRSSSMPTEKAQDIMESICFVIGLRLKSCDSPEQAVDILKTEPLGTIFENGMKRVQRKIVVSKHLQKYILSHLFATPNEFYYSTIAEGISGFFKLYRPEYAAHEIHITADYPVLLGRPELNGIEFIEQYLRCIDAENAFCTCFDARKIHHLLCGLMIDYKSVPMNLFEPVVLSALGLVTVEKNPMGLDLDKKDLHILQQHFLEQSVQEIGECLKEALYQLNQIINLSQTSLNYALLCIPKLAAAIQNAVNLKTLDKVFLIPNRKC